jgi:hypothetical protein
MPRVSTKPRQPKPAFVGFNSKGEACAFFTNVKQALEAYFSQRIATIAIFLGEKKISV